MRTGWSGKESLNITVDNADIAVLWFGGEIPGPLVGLPVLPAGVRADLDTVIGGYRRLVVVGADADLAAVLTRLLRTDRLGVEVGYTPVRHTAATRAYRLPAGRRAARRARCGSARRAPLIRDETGTVIVGSAVWLPPEEGRQLRGEAVVDDTVLFDGDVAGVRIEPTATLPGLRARVLGGRGWSPRWQAGRAAQLGSTGAVMLRDGVRSSRPIRRSTFYRHTEGWLLVR
ncbi:MAG: peptidase M50 [Mycobacterium sp.]|uniref:peptidase M50 n=1 Tax=Mycobacterium sp. TaxID=1785 RepID=UPI002622CC88|nr:peptidase M50 [Mycobacterium sp.]MDI3313470.1 peptidase M50 [Mycobacterium sp.]